MTITTKVWDVPELSIGKQLFYVPGISTVGGFTVGGARVSTTEQGGFAFLDFQPVMRLEWKRPIMSWLMSKTNGEVLRVRLAPTPQVMTGELIRGTGTPFGGIYQFNLQRWKGDIQSRFTTVALKGTSTITVDMGDFGQVLQAGHVIGHAYDCYMIDEIAYDTSNVATLTIKPPLRRNVAVNDPALFRPYFTGAVMNADEVRNMYDAGDNGFNAVGKITLGEVIL